jgi:hypothetical protein
MTRDRYSDWDLGPFSDWHREKLPTWVPWTDIDYVGYQDGGDVVYILLELKCLPDDEYEPFSPSEPPKENQLRAYLTLSNALDTPAFVVWHTEDCHQFKIDPIVELNGVADYDTSERVCADGRSGFLDFLDRYRPEAVTSADQTFTNRVLSEWVNEGDSDA